MRVVRDGGLPTPLSQSGCLFDWSHTAVPNTANRDPGYASELFRGTRGTTASRSRCPRRWCVIAYARSRSLQYIDSCVCAVSRSSASTTVRVLHSSAIPCAHSHSESRRAAAEGLSLGDAESIVEMTEIAGPSSSKAGSRVAMPRGGVPAERKLTTLCTRSSSSGPSPSGEGAPITARMSTKTSTDEQPEKSLSPPRDSSATATPAPQMSTAGAAERTAQSTSGDCIGVVPTQGVSPPPPDRRGTAAEPKSESNTLPVWSISRFDSFTSLCTTPWAWQCASPPRICVVILRSSLPTIQPF
eukprot:Hpha_TRINITY_DN15889_c3_g3::TRINITY_DN15889_c3_g3_i2::g.191427::m.191427